VTFVRQREHEKRRALFSCYYWAIYCWNLEELKTAGEPPGREFWRAILVRRSPCVFYSVWFRGLHLFQYPGF
jgi:hypothetical protein